MKIVNIHEAKTHLSRLLRQVMRGEEIIIARGGTPVARLSPLATERERVFGTDRGVFEVPDDFNAPLPDDLQAAFER
jgi:prevent-host-death family protein